MFSQPFNGQIGFHSRPRLFAIFKRQFTAALYAKNKSVQNGMEREFSANFMVFDFFRAKKAPAIKQGQGLYRSRL
jgi:hypothetical protein